MTLALGIVFWILVIVTAVLWLINRPQPPWPWPNMLLFILIILLGISEFGGLHLVR